MGSGLGLPGESFLSGGDNFFKIGPTKDRQKLDNNNFTLNNSPNMHAITRRLYMTYTEGLD